MRIVKLIGDSISLDYGRYLSDYSGKNISFKERSGVEEAYKNLDAAIGGNGGDSSRVLGIVKNLEKENKLDFDLFVFNCGLHDIKRARPDEILQIGKEEYIKNLTEIINIMKAHNIECVFITTTQADEKRYSPEAAFTRYAADAEAYNEAAIKIMTENSVKIIDLYGFTHSLGLEGDDLYRDHTHFNPEVIKLQAAFIAGYLIELCS